MGIAMSRRWALLSAEGLAPVTGHMGVYQLGDAAGEVLYIGYAGGRSLHGLRGELLRWQATPGRHTHYRIEVNTAYLTRWLELLMEHRARVGALPVNNPTEDNNRLGRLSPG